MHQVGEQKINVEVFGSLQIGEVGVREHRVVLPDKPERKFLGELIIPLAPDDVVIHAAERPGQLRLWIRAVRTGSQTKEDVGIVNSQ